MEGIDPISKIPYKVSVGPERFLAPEMFFNPEIVDERYRKSVDELIDNVIQLCPIDTRRKLYNNIALSGGSTLFRGFKDRLERRVTERVHDRLKKYEMKSGTKVILAIFSRLQLTSRFWIILTSVMLSGWVGRFWQESRVLPKCTIHESNIKKWAVRSAGITPSFLSDYCN